MQGETIIPCAVGTGFNINSLPTPLMSNNSCNNYLSGLTYTFHFNIDTTGKANILDVYIDILYGYPRTSPFITQKFSSVFSSTPLKTKIIKKSGNPGYFSGKMIMTGIVKNNIPPVLYNPDPYEGITLIAQKRDGTCTGSSKKDIYSRVPLSFGEDTHSGCLVYFTYNDLTNNCNSIRQSIWEMQLGSANSLITSIGKFGNSSINVLDDWIPIQSQLIGISDLNSLRSTVY